MLSCHGIITWALDILFWYLNTVRLPKPWRRERDVIWEVGQPSSTLNENGHRVRGHCCLCPPHNCITSPGPWAKFRPPDDSSCCLPGQRHPVLTRWSAVVSSFIEHKTQEVSTGINRCRGKPQNGFVLSRPCGFCNCDWTRTTMFSGTLRLCLNDTDFVEECLGYNQWTQWQNNSVKVCTIQANESVSVVLIVRGVKKKS